MDRYRKLINYIRNIGINYIIYRSLHTIKCKLGWYKIVFRKVNSDLFFIDLLDWKENVRPFFFQGKTLNGLELNPEDTLKRRYEKLIKNDYVFFGHKYLNLSGHDDWITNPISKVKYDINKHWSEIEDFSKKAGDIKYVWEKARFSFLIDVIRYDFHFCEDQSKYAIDQIIDFINKNPINYGPNYKCSQEISLRLFNWIIVLYYYKDSKFLTQLKFNRILTSIYWQTHHVYKNIKFSKNCVRNNHVLTESLLLFTIGKIFPFFKNVEKWGNKGKKIFEKEISYQIYDDGTFLQFSMNYHRVLIQLLTWAIKLGELNHEKFDESVYKKAEKALRFLDVSCDFQSGKVPNFGPNDGALFFKFNNDNFNDFRSQLDDLRSVLYGERYYDSESSKWYGQDYKIRKFKPELECLSFKDGGYYIVNESKCKTFIKCGSFRHRPYQSDNLHLDLWVDGRNILRDSGTYLYNTEEKYSSYFTGSEGHNTTSLGKADQMVKGKRFIWFYWVKNAQAELKEGKSEFYFEGTIKTYNCIFKRKVVKIKNKFQWEIEDTAVHDSDENILQYWHLPMDMENRISFHAKNENGKTLTPIIEKKYFSEYYGSKEESLRYTFSNSTKNIFTTIKFV